MLFFLLASSYALQVEIPVQGGQGNLRPIALVERGVSAEDLTKLVAAFSADAFGASAPKGALEISEHPNLGDDVLGYCEAPETWKTVAKNLKEGAEAAKKKISDEALLSEFTTAMAKLEEVLDELPAEAKECKPAFIEVSCCFAWLTRLWRRLFPVVEVNDRAHRQAGPVALNEPLQDFLAMHSSYGPRAPTASAAGHMIADNAYVFPSEDFLRCITVSNGAGGIRELEVVAGPCDHPVIYVPFGGGQCFGVQLTGADHWITYRMDGCDNYFVTNHGHDPYIFHCNGGSLQRQGAANRDFKLHTINAAVAALGEGWRIESTINGAYHDREDYEYGFGWGHLVDGTWQNFIHKPVLGDRLPVNMEFVPVPVEHEHDD